MTKGRQSVEVVSPPEGTTFRHHRQRVAPLHQSRGLCRPFPYVGRAYALQDMQTLTWLDHSSLQRLRAVVALDDSIVAPATVDALSRVIRDTRFDVVVIDPAFLPAPHSTRTVNPPVSTVLGEMRAVPRLAVIYADMSATLVREAVTLARSYVVELVWRNQRDEATQLRSCLDRVRAQTSTLLALIVDAHLLHQFEGLPARWREILRGAVRTAIERPERIRRSGDLAFVARCGERTLARRITRAGITGVVDLLTAARIARAHERLQLPNMRVVRVSGELGYLSVRGLRAATVRSSGMTPSELRILRSEDVARRIGAWLTNSNTPHFANDNDGHVLDAAGHLEGRGSNRTDPPLDRTVEAR